MGGLTDRAVLHALASVIIALMAGRTLMTRLLGFIQAACFLLLGAPLCPASPLAPVPAEIASSHFVVTINGEHTPVMHAAMNLYFLNFDAGKRTAVTVTADSDDFWAKGVEVQPWRLNLRPRRNGRTISFDVNGPAKISISRPGDFGSDAEMLYLFANVKEKHPPVAGGSVRFYGPGVHHENIDAADGDHIYLAPGAVVFGSLNVWKVSHVSVSGRGVIVYDGPQNPADDDGWMHKPNWHCIVMDNAHDISIEGITCVVRSRTWQIQMKDSRNILFQNIKVIGANAGNANADGMDWLGGGDTIVRDSFFRAADDVFAMQSSWEGYGPAAFAVQGKPVTNITVENSVLSTSISNIVRAAWPQKNFEGGNFLLRDSDVLHIGPGGCGIPFALMELWADPNGRGKSAKFAFENIRMEDWYSLVQLRQPVDGVRDVSFKDISGLEYPSLVPSELKGSIKNVSFDRVALAGSLLKQSSDLPIDIVDGAQQPSFTAGLPMQIKSTEGLIQPGQKVRFDAVEEDSHDKRYNWTFGDGSHASGRSVSHKFTDTDGTLRDGSGRFRVLLEVRDNAGRHIWLYKPIIVSNALKPALLTAGNTPGLAYTYREAGAQSDAASPQSGVALSVSLAAVPHSAADYSLAFDGNLQAPAEGGYTFLVEANDSAAIDIDGTHVETILKPMAQVCGLPGMAARVITANVALAKGRHIFHLSETHTSGQDNFRVLWQGPGFSLGPIPPDLLSH